LLTEDAPRLENTYASELEGLYAAIQPEGFPDPALLLLNEPLAGELGLDPTWLQSHGPAVLSGSKTLPGSQPIAQTYAGHQFGSFNPQLGDGRAFLMGEVVTPDGRRFDLQLKGSGVTPYSRRGDGRAALDSAVREYIVSEAMHALRVPTTRSLAVVTTGEAVMRQRMSPGAVLTRVASSHLRIGTLEYFAARQETENVQRLVQYALRRHYPAQSEAQNPAKALLDEVAKVQAQLVSQWMALGFVHGVMNTDNVTLSGETIDYGPCAFMEAYDPQTVFSQVDRGGRYAFGNQPGIGSWNLARMAEALIDLLDDSTEAAVELAQESLQLYRETFAAAYLAKMRSKLGLTGQHEAHGELIQDLLDVMKQEGADYTQTFRKLSRSLLDDSSKPGEALQPWVQRWKSHLSTADAAQTARAMDAVNPVYIPRNHRVEEALDAALQGDMGPTSTLMEVLGRPFEDQPGRQRFAEPAGADFGPYSTHCNT